MSAIVICGRSRPAEVTIPTIQSDEAGRLNLDVAILQAAIWEQNEVIRRLANETNAPLLDLAQAEIPSDQYVDGYHFNASGNQFRANLLAELIEERYSAKLAGLE